jgi:hypothetical protein
MHYLISSYKSKFPTNATFNYQYITVYCEISYVLKKGNEDDHL